MQLLAETLHIEGVFQNFSKPRCIQGTGSVEEILSPGTQSKKIKADPEIFSASRGTATNTEEVS